MLWRLLSIFSFWSDRWRSPLTSIHRRFNAENHNLSAHCLSISYRHWRNKILLGDPSYSHLRPSPAPAQGGEALPERIRCRHWWQQVVLLARAGFSLGGEWERAIEASFVRIGLGLRLTNLISTTIRPEEPAPVIHPASHPPFYLVLWLGCQTPFFSFLFPFSKQKLRSLANHVKCKLKVKLWDDYL